jgi:stage II sporulation protein D
MPEGASAIDLSGSSLSFGRDDEEAAFSPLRSIHGTVRVVDGLLEINGVAWQYDAVRFRLGGNGSDGSIRVGGFRVRGDLVVRLHSSRLQLINVLPLEEYLVGVVGAEMPAGFPDEALKAQAVAARTYALRKKLDAIDPSIHLGASVLHQVYRGLSYRRERVFKAIEATRGEVLTFNLEPIEAYFHASCGGRTESGQPALSRDLPYLQSVECPCGRLASSRWELLVSAAELRNFFGIPDVGSLGISARSSTGRARTLSLGSGRLLDAVEFRQKLGYERLKSLWFELDRRGGEAIKIVGRGHGHGAGLCQWGAKAYADQGWTYREILLHYYPGIEIQQLY